MIVPSAMNVFIIGLSNLIFVFLWRVLAAYLARKGQTQIAGAMATAG